MLNKTFITVIFILIVISTVSFSQDVNEIEPGSKPMKAFFDGNDGLLPPLTLQSCFGDNYHTSDEDPPMPNEFKSKKWTRIDEWWKGKSRILTITRWYFEYPQDALIYHKIRGIGTSSPFTFPGWAKDIGDGNFWCGDKCVFFVKKNVTVSVSVNSKILGKSYIESIAKRIAEKL